MYIHYIYIFQGQCVSGLGVILDFSSAFVETKLRSWNMLMNNEYWTTPEEIIGTSKSNTILKFTMGELTFHVVFHVCVYIYIYSHTCTHTYIYKYKCSSLH